MRDYQYPFHKYISQIHYKKPNGQRITGGGLYHTFAHATVESVQFMRLLDGEAEYLARKTTNFHSEQIMRARITSTYVKRECGACYTERCKLTRPALRMAAPP